MRLIQQGLPSPSCPVLHQSLRSLVYSRTRRDWFLGESAGNLGGLLSVPWDLSCINVLKRIRGLQFDVLRLNKLLR